MRTDLEVREPRCRVCRDETVRRHVNELLDWRGVPVPIHGGGFRRVTLADIYRALGPINESRHGRSPITYSALWVHAKRHHEIAGKVAYWAARIRREFWDALGAKGCRKPVAKVQESQLSTKNGTGMWVIGTPTGLEISDQGPPLGFAPVNVDLQDRPTAAMG